MLELKTVILECGDLEKESAFYQKLLGWPVTFREDEFIRLQSESGMGIAFQYDAAYIPPVWPAEPGKQQMMAHLDFGVSDAGELKMAVAKAIRLGAVPADTQYGDGEWTTMLDPAGHPFCFVIWG